MPIVEVECRSHSQFCNIYSYSKLEETIQQLRGPCPATDCRQTIKWDNFRLETSIVCSLVYSSVCTICTWTRSNEYFIFTAYSRDQNTSSRAKRDNYFCDASACVRMKFIFHFWYNSRIEMAKWRQKLAKRLRCMRNAHLIALMMIPSQLQWPLTVPFLIATASNFIARKY